MQRSLNLVMRRAAGFSLVELMVAMALSLLLLAGVVAIFSSSRVSYESTDQLSRIQETGRFAIDLISRHVRSAGFSGCSRQPNYISTVLGSTAVQWNFLGGAVQGFEGSASGWTPALDTGGEPVVPAATPATPGTDVLVVRGPRLGARPALLTVPMANATDPLQVSSAADFNGDGVVMAYSCEAQSIFHAFPSGTTLTHGTGVGVPGNLSESINFPFRAGAEIVPIESVVYYVSASTGTVPAGTNSLYRRVALTNPPEELVQGVEQMQVQYGIDTNLDRVVDSYVNAAAVANWDRVVAVRVALLVRSVQEYGTDRDTRSYTLLNNPPIPAANDRRLREVFTTTVSIRNRARTE